MHLCARTSVCVYVMELEAKPGLFWLFNCVCYQRIHWNHQSYIRLYCSGHPFVIGIFVRYRYLLCGFKILFSFPLLSLLSLFTQAIQTGPFIFSYNTRFRDKIILFFFLLNFNISFIFWIFGWFCLLSQNGPYLTNYSSLEKKKKPKMILGNQFFMLLFFRFTFLAYHQSSLSFIFFHS